MTLTASSLRKLLAFDPTTGLFRWRVKRGSRGVAGAVAGTVDANGYTVIKIAGERYYAARLAVLAVTGHWPACYVTFRNKKRSDTRWRNLRAA